ncbi:MAG: zinc ribbon domain-containing protein [Candidatus Helarchaeota archaeon]
MYVDSEGTCPVVLEKEILLEHIANQSEQWEEKFISEMKQHNYKLANKNHNKLLFKKEWKKNLFIHYKQNNNDLWVYYKVKFSNLVRSLFIVLLILYVVIDLVIFFFNINLVYMIYSEHLMVNMMAIVYWLFSVIILFIIILFNYQYPVMVRKLRNENIILNIRTSAKNAMKKVIKDKIKKVVGEKSREIKYCPSCGKELNPDWNFCPFCNIKLVSK